MHGDHGAREEPEKNHVKVKITFGKKTFLFLSGISSVERHERRHNANI
jgi:hypothetical protein